MAQSFVLGVDLQIQKVLGLDAIKSQLASIVVTPTVNAGGGNFKDVAVQLNAIQSASTAAGLAVNKFNISTSQIGGAMNTTVSAAAKTAESIGEAGKDIQNFGDRVLIAGKRYAAFVAATAVAFKAVEFINDAVKSSIEFESALTRLDQIMDEGSARIANLKQQFLDLSVATGTSAKDLTEVATILAQAGLGNAIDDALKPLANVPLLPAFKDLKGTTEGLIAIFNQFKLTGADTGKILDLLNEAANKYAVTSEDIIEGVKRGGAAFAATGGSLKEFIILFTTIRHVTQLSAETVGTALKTISARVFQPTTQSFLSKEGITVINKLTGEFVGLNNILLQVADKFDTLTIPRQQEFARQLGGLRQIGQVLAAVRNPQLFGQIEADLAKAAGSAQRDAVKALETTSKQLDILAAKANAFVQALAPDTILPFIKSLITLGEAAVFLVDKLSPLIPLLLSLGGIAVARSLSNIGGSLLSKLGGVGTGGILGDLGDQLLFGPVTAIGGNTNQARIQRRLGGGVGGPESPSLVGSAKGVLQNPLAGSLIFAALGTLTARMFKTEAAIGFLGKEAAGTAGNIVQFSTSLLTAIALLRGQSILQAGKGLLSGIGGAFGLTGAAGLIGGALVGTALVAGASHASALNETIDTLLNASVEQIRKIDFATLNVSGPNFSKVQNQIGLLAEVFVTGPGFQKIEDFDIGKAKDGVDAITRFSDNVFTLLTSLDAIKGVFSGQTVGDVKRLAAIKQFVETNLDDLSTLFESSAKNTLQHTITSFVGALASRPGVTPQAAQEITNELIGQLGGTQAAETRLTAARSTNELTEAQKNVKIELQKITRDLSSLIIPTRLTGQLLQFSKAVDTVTAAINNSAQEFTSQIGTLQGIGQAPINLQQNATQVKNLFQTGGLDFFFKNQPEIPKFVRSLNEIENLTNQFILRISNLPTEKLSSTTLAKEIESFFEFQKNIPPEVKKRLTGFFNQIGSDLINAAGTKLITPGELKKNLEDELKNLGIEARDAIVDQVGNALENIFKQIQDRANRLSTLRKLELEANILPGARAEFLQNQIGRAGVNAFVGRPGQNLEGVFDKFIEDIRRRGGSVQNARVPSFRAEGAQLADIVFDPRVREDLTRKIKSVTDEMSSLRINLSQLKAGGEQGSNAFINSAKRLEELQRQSIELQTSFEALSSSTQEAFQARKDELQLNQQIKRAQTEARLQEGVSRGFIDPEAARRELFDLGQTEIKERQALDLSFKETLQDDARRRLELAQIVDKNTQTQLDAANIMLDSANIFSQAVLPLTQLNQSAIKIPTTENVGTIAISPEQILSGAVTTQQGIDAINATIKEGNVTSQATQNLLNAILQAQERNLPSAAGTQQPTQEIKPAETNEQTNKLIGSLDNLKKTIDEPGQLKLATEQQINLDISGLPEQVKNEISPLLQQVAESAARTIIRQALESLASKTEIETSIAIQGVVKELE